MREVVFVLPLANEHRRQSLCFLSNIRKPRIGYVFSIDVVCLWLQVKNP